MDNTLENSIREPKFIYKHIKHKSWSLETSATDFDPTDAVAWPASRDCCLSSFYGNYQSLQILMHGTELHSTQDIPNVLPVQKQPLDTCVDLIYSHYMATFEDKVDKKICFVVTHWMRAVKSVKGWG